MDTESRSFSMFHWLNIHNWREWNHSTLIENTKSVMYSVIQKILVSSQIDTESYLQNCLHLRSLARGWKPMHGVWACPWSNEASPAGLTWWPHLHGLTCVASSCRPRLRNLGTWFGAGRHHCLKKAAVKDSGPGWPCSLHIYIPSPSFRSLFSWGSEQKSSSSSSAETSFCHKEGEKLETLFPLWALAQHFPFLTLFPHPSPLFLGPENCKNLLFGVPSMVRRPSHLHRSAWPWTRAPLHWKQGARESLLPLLGLWLPGPSEGEKACLCLSCYCNWPPPAPVGSALSSSANPNTAKLSFLFW